MSHEIAVADVNIHPYILSVTTRDAGEDAKLLEELTYRTIATWLHIVKFLKQNVYKFEGGSVEQRYADEINKRIDTDAPQAEPFEFKETFGDSRVTVWDTYRGAEHPCFHLSSDDNPQVAIDTWLANQRGIQRAIEKFAPSGSNLIQDTPPANVTEPQQPNTQERPATSKNAQQANVATNQAVEGAIVATQRPNANTPQYANGQLVSFTVTKIVATSNKGSAVYQMWTPLGTQYPTINVYKLKPDGNLKPDYEAIVPVLNTLGLSLDKPEAVGAWRLVVKAAHVPSKDNSSDKEYLNVVSLAAI